MSAVAAQRAVLGERLAAGARALGLALSAAQQARLLDYLALLEKWNAVYNLTAVREPAQMVTQHLLDALAAAPAFAGAKSVLDVGAGGGVPGLVLAIWAAEAEPELRLALIDTVHKKTAFLTQAKAELGLERVSVHTGRVEQLRAGPFEVITARAFAELADLVAWSGHLLAPGGRFIALKGQRSEAEAEIARLPAGWAATGMQALAVPGLGAERHLVFIERRERQ